MNILILSWRDPKHPFAGGAEQVMHEHMKGWIATGHKVTLFSSRIKGNSKKEETLDGVKIIRRGIQFFGVQLLGFLYYIGHRNEFDLVVDEFHGLPFFTPLYVKRPILAVIQEVAGKVWLKNDLPVPLNWIVGALGYLGEPFLFLFYKKILFMTGSESTKKSLLKLGIPSKNIRVIDHGVTLPICNVSGQKPKIKTVMYLGAITIDKGIDQALQVFNILDKRGKFNFWVAGRAGDRYIDYLREETKRLGISRRFKFYGFVDENKKFELLSKAHVFINPSVLEGWGLVNIEANSVGTPVVAYNSLGLVDSVKDGVSGIIVKRNTPQELAKAVDKVISDKDLYKRLQRGAISWSRKFSWDISKKKSLTLINEIVRV